MTVLESSRDFRRIKPRVVLGQTLLRHELQRAEELAAGAVLHAEVEVRLRLERVVEGDDERMIGRSEDLLLCKDALDLLAFDHLAFREDCS